MLRFPVKYAIVGGPANGIGFYIHLAFNNLFCEPKNDGEYGLLTYWHLQGDPCDPVNGLNVYIGKQISIGEVIGYVGESGSAGAPHLHLGYYPNYMHINERIDSYNPIALFNYDRWIREAAHRRELRWARLVLLEQAGRLPEARAELTALETAASGTERATWSVLTEALGEKAAAEVAAAKRSEEALQGMAAAKEAETKPEALALAVYPHPLKNRGMLMLGLPEAAKVRVVVYDVLGREVGVLLSGLQSAGWHQVALDGRRWRSGWYVVRAEIVWMDGRVEVRTQPLLRMP